MLCSRHSHVCEGMTLVELLLTMVLLGIVASVALPRMNYSAIHQAQLRTTGQEFGGALRLARCLAVADAGVKSQGYKVLQGSGTYRLTNASTAVTVKGPFVIPSGIQVSGSSEIQFNRLGETSDGLGKSVAFSRQGKRVSVTVTPVGGIRVVE